MSRCPTCGQPVPRRATPRQREVLTLLAEGLRTREIAAQLHISLKTVESHLGNLKRLSGVETQTGLVRWAFREGLVAIPSKEDESENDTK
jgi:DNA-binding NarL/FixJ family response regulator